MTDMTDPWLAEIIEDEERLAPTYDLDAFIAAVQAEPHRADELLETAVPPSRYTEAEATLIVKGLLADPEREVSRYPWEDEDGPERNAPQGGGPDPKAAATRIASLERQIRHLRRALAALGAVAIVLMLG